MVNICLYLTVIQKIIFSFGVLIVLFIFLSALISVMQLIDYCCKNNYVALCSRI